MAVTHPFVSAVSDGADTAVVRPSNWNADHTVAIGGTPAPVLDTTNAAGNATTYLRTNDQLALFDATAPTTQAFSDAAATGSAAIAARRDHKHAWPALGTTAAAVGTSAGGAAATPSKSDHVHATGAGTPATVSTSNATGSGPAAAMTDHVHAHETAHMSHDTIWDAKGDIAAGTAADTASALTVGADDTILMADAAASTGLKWVASASPSAVGTAAVTGTADTFTRGDHVHAHEAAHEAHDTIWDAAGDLVQGTGADTATKLARGTSLTDRLVVNGTSLAWLPHIVTITSTGATVNNSTVLVNVTGMSFAIAASEKWYFQFFGLVTGASATADHKFGWTYPTSCTMTWGPVAGGTAALSGFGYTAASNSPGAILTAASTMATGGLNGQSGIALAGFILNSTNAGTIQLQYAQNTQTVENNTVDANSTMFLWRLA